MFRIYLIYILKYSQLNLKFRYGSRHDLGIILGRVLGVSLGMKAWNHYLIRRDL